MKLTDRFLALMSVLILTTVLLLGLQGSLVDASSTGPGAPPSSGTTAAANIRTFYRSALTTVTETTTIYAATSNETGANVSGFHHSADIFVSIDISGTGAVTVTPQVSADNVNWADASYTYQGTPLNYVTTVTATTVSTQTASTTSTVSTSGTPTLYSGNYQLVADADGETVYTVMPVAGYYMRYKIEYSATGTITPSIVAVLKND